MSKTTFVWDPVNDCVLSELDDTNSVAATYTNEPGKYGGVLSQRRASTTSILHGDGLGTTRALTTSSEAVSDTYLFDAWGNSLASTGSTHLPYRWVGEHGYSYASSTGLTYVRARMYSPSISRWISTDPIGFSDGINRYRYANNAPVLAIDPSGKAVFWCARNLAFPIPTPGNHHFIWIEPDDPKCLEEISDVELKKLHHVVSNLIWPSTKKDDICGFSIGGHNVNGKLVVIFNQRDDIKSIQEKYCCNCRWRTNGKSGTVCHEVDAPDGMSDCEFIKRLIGLGKIFQRNQSPPYHIDDSNCCMVANSVFKHAGVPLDIRIECGEFWGVDWSEEELLDKALFLQCTNPD